MQYYGINDDGDTVYVAMSEKEVINYAKKHPEEGIIRVEDKFKHGYNLKESYIITESLKKWDKKEFEDNSNSYELEMLYESVKNTLSAQQKNDLVKFVRKARTADEINTYMTGMLVQNQANESLQEATNDNVDEESFNKLKEIAYELDDYVEDKVWVRDFWFDGQFDTTISFEIYGDWKHDHARFDYYAKEWLDNKGLDYKMWETITDEDGSDTYGATHTIRLYDIAKEDTVEEGYIPQSSPQKPVEEPEKFSNGTLRDFDPYPFMRKIMNSGKSMNSIRTLGDDYYTIFVSYMNHFGPKGIDDFDTKYTLDIIKETPDGEQTRELFERNLLWSDVAEKLLDWRQDKVTKNPLAEGVSSNLSKINNSVYAADAFTVVLNNLSDKLDGYDEFSDGEFEVSYQGSKKELQREIMDAFADAGITLEKERDALTYSIPNNYDAYIYISEDDDASTYTENSIGYYIKAETVL